MFASRAPLAGVWRWFAAVALGLATITQGGSQTYGGEPVLCVGPSGDVVHLAVAWPQGVAHEAGEAYRLVDARHPEAASVVQAIAAVAADGTVAHPAGRLTAAVPASTAASQWRLVRGGAATGDAFSFQDRDGRSLELRQGDRPVLTYNYGVITRDDLPEKEARRRRACYVHPVWGLNGEVLTDDFPRDHYHHHGIFWTWPHVAIEGRQYDLWADRGIRQEFVAWLGKSAGPVCAVIGVENGWFVEGRKVMIERVWLRAYRQEGDQRALDVELTFIPVDRPVTLWGAEGKSYGGLTMRFMPGPRSESQITVPAGPAKDDLPDTPLAWADYTSQFGKGLPRSGAAVFVPESHPDYPPTWLTRYYGPLCVGWPGVHARECSPGVPIRLNYRIWIHQAAGEHARLQAAYAAYHAGNEAGWKAP